MLILIMSDSSELCYLIAAALSNISNFPPVRRHWDCEETQGGKKKRKKKKKKTFQVHGKL